MERIRIAVACSSNTNRSMAAHAYLQSKGFSVKSFGTSDMVRLPSVTPYQQNCYEFGTPYRDIYQDLFNKHQSFYNEIGLLGIIDRNQRLKECPERFQDCNERFDVIITCCKRVFDEVFDFFVNRQSSMKSFVHIINIEIEDTLEGAFSGSLYIYDLVSKIYETKDLVSEIKYVVDAFEVRNYKSVDMYIVTY